MQYSDAIEKSLELITGGDPALDVELLEAFLLTSHDYIANLRAADKANDFESWQGDAHSMKGGCFNIGIDDLGEMCRTAESQAESPSAKRQEILQNIEKEFARVEAIVLAMIKEKKARIQ